MVAVLSDLPGGSMIMVLGHGHNMRCRRTMRRRGHCQRFAGRRKDGEKSEQQDGDAPGNHGSNSTHSVRRNFDLPQDCILHLPTLGGSSPIWRTFQARPCHPSHALAATVSPSIRQRNPATALTSVKVRSPGYGSSSPRRPIPPTQASTRRCSAPKARAGTPAGPWAWFRAPWSGREAGRSGTGAGPATLLAADPKRQRSWPRLAKGSGAVCHPCSSITAAKTFGLPAHWIVSGSSASPPRSTR